MPKGPGFLASLPSQSLPQEPCRAKTTSLKRLPFSSWPQATIRAHLGGENSAADARSDEQLVVEYHPPSQQTEERGEKRSNSWTT